MKALKWVWPASEKWGWFPLFWDPPLRQLSSPLPTREPIAWTETVIGLCPAWNGTTQPRSEGSLSMHLVSCLRWCSFSAGPTCHGFVTLLLHLFVRLGLHTVILESGSCDRSTITLGNLARCSLGVTGDVNANRKMAIHLHGHVAELLYGGPQKA